MSALTRATIASAVVVSIGAATSAARPAFAQERECFNGTPIACEYHKSWYCEARLQAVPIWPYVMPYLACGFKEIESKWWSARAGNEENDRYLQVAPPKVLPPGGEESD